MNYVSVHFYCGSCVTEFVPIFGRIFAAFLTIINVHEQSLAILLTAF